MLRVRNPSRLAAPDLPRLPRSAAWGGGVGYWLLAVQMGLDVALELSTPRGLTRWLLPPLPDAPPHLSLQRVGLASGISIDYK